MQNFDAKMQNFWCKKYPLFFTISKVLKVPNSEILQFIRKKIAGNRKF